MRRSRAVRTLLPVVASALAAAPCLGAEDMLAQPPVPKPRPAHAAPATATDAATNAAGRAAKDGTREAAAPAGRDALRALARREAMADDVPFDLVDAVMKVESDYRPDRVGDVGEIGLMQVRPGTAAMLGFSGSAAELADPATNIHFGTSYLAGAWHQAHGNVCRALMKYRAGHGNETMTPLSVSYCQRARAHLLAVDSPLAALILPADLVATAPGPAGSAADEARGPAPFRRLGSTRPVLPGESLTTNGRYKTGAAFWTAFETRVRRINAGLEAKWRRTASR